MSGAPHRNGQLNASAEAATRALAWRVGWLALIAVFGLALALTPPGVSRFVVVGLVLAAMPAVLDLQFAPSATWRSISVVAWAVGGALAANFNGGVSGPLAAWCLAPVVAAAMGEGAPQDMPRRLAEGATLALMGAAVVALAQLAGLNGPSPPAELALWLGLLALGSTALGVGAGLIVSGRGAATREGELNREARSLQNTLEAQPFMLLSMTREGRVRQIWGAPIEGAPNAALMRGGLPAVGRPEDDLTLRLAPEAAIADGQAEVAFTPRTAQDRSLVASLRRLGDGQILAAVRDVTAEQAREASLEQQKAEAESRAAGRSRFLANMSHELRTPLNAIMGFSDIMRARMFGPLEGRYGEYVELIHESGRHLLDLISDLLDMSKIDAERYELDREIMDVREPITAALRLMRLQADAAGVALRGLLPPTSLEIDGDPRAIKQMVLNLVSNALKFTPKGGAVTVTAQAYRGQFELIVADTGVGISPEDLARLGRPFEQAGDSEQRAQGSGLGLSLVRAFAELHGGEMQLESRLGAGTTITVRLPVGIAGQEAEPEAPAEEEAAGPPTIDNVVPFSPTR